MAIVPPMRSATRVHLRFMAFLLLLQPLRPQEWTASSLPLGPPCLRELLAQHPPECLFEGLGPAFHMLPKRLIDQRLVASPTRTMDGTPEPREQVIVEPDRDPRLPWGYRHHGSPAGLGEVVLVPDGPHRLFP